MSDSHVQDTAVLWALSRSARVLIQEGYMVLLDIIHHTVGCLMKPFLRVERTVALAPAMYLYFVTLINPSVAVANDDNLTLFDSLFS